MKTNFDEIKDMTVEQAGHYICEEINNNVGCDECPFTHRCSDGHTGVTEWLKGRSEYETVS